MNALWVDYDRNEVAALDGCAHLWEISASADCAQYLDEAERAKILRIRDVEDQSHYEAAMGGLRKIVSLYRNCAVGEVRFLRGPRGKPYVEGGPHFNLSHTLGRIFVIVSPEEVGLDVEGAFRRVMADEVAAKFYSKDEREYLRELAPEERKAFFLRLWVCKEAMVKLSGDGIYHGLRDAQVILGPEGPESGVYRGRNVWLWQFSPVPGFVAAMAGWKKLEVKCFFRF